MEKNCCAAYLRQVKRKLRCSRADKRRLLDGLEAELTDIFPRGCFPSMTQVLDRFGLPEEVARELEAALTPEELERARKRRRLLMGIAFVVCAVVIILLIVYAVRLITILNGRVIVNTQIIYRN